MMKSGITILIMNSDIFMIMYTAEQQETMGYAF
jgi:hypothetical protein